MGEKISCEKKPPWYNQLIQMDEKARVRAVEVAMAKLKKSKPETYEFIKKEKCELVGFVPNIEDTLPNNEENALDVTYLHDFSQYTMLFWCPAGGFGFFVNASLEYNARGLRGFAY